MTNERVSTVQQGQHGLITRGQAHAAGMTDAQIETLMRRGTWVADQAGVYAPAGLPLSPHRALMAAVLAGGEGTLASHRSAAWLWGVAAAPPTPEITVTRPRGPRPQGAIVHRIIDLAQAGTSLRDGINTTNPMRTLVDFGSVVSISELRDSVHAAVAARLVNYVGLEAEVERLARRGRRGIGPMRRVLGERIDRTRAPSVLESRTDRVLRMANVPEPDVERIAGPDGEYRTDYRWEDARLILEVKGFSAHGSPEASANDVERELVLAEAGGYQVLAADWRQVSSHGPRLARQIETIYWARRQLLLGA